MITDLSDRSHRSCFLHTVYAFGISMGLLFIEIASFSASMAVSVHALSFLRAPSEAMENIISRPWSCTYQWCEAASNLNRCPGRWIGTKSWNLKRYPPLLNGGWVGFVAVAVAVAVSWPMSVAYSMKRLNALKSNNSLAPIFSSLHFRHGRVLMGSVNHTIPIIYQR